MKFHRLFIAAILGASSLRAAALAQLSPGLLGTNYLGVSYAWHELGDLPLDASSFGLEANWAVARNVDLLLSYDELRTYEFFGLRGEGRTFLASVRLSTATKSGRPYFELGGGWTWAEVTGVVSEDSAGYLVGAGWEAALGRAVLLTPFVRYQEFEKGGGDGTFTYGLKAHWWIHRHWALNGSIADDDAGDLTYSIGTNFRF